MSARRAVGAALKAKDKDAENTARDRVQIAKEAVGRTRPEVVGRRRELKAPKATENTEDTQRITEGITEKLQTLRHLIFFVLSVNLSVNLCVSSVFSVALGKKNEQGLEEAAVCGNRIAH